MMRRESVIGGSVREENRQVRRIDPIVTRTGVRGPLSPFLFQTRRTVLLCVVIVISLKN